MKVLALDTCLGSCSAAVLIDGEPASALIEPMARGHQERLGGMVAAAMDQAGLGFSALDRIAVTVGPGSFTGLRVGLAFAKGLALVLKRPLIGVGSLEAMAASVDQAGHVWACLDAGRGQVYLQAFQDGRAVAAPEVLPVDVAAARLAASPAGQAVRLIGSGGALIGGAAGESTGRCAPDPIAIARLAASAEPPFAPAAPIYLRPPDARPRNP